MNRHQRRQTKKHTEVNPQAHSSAGLNQLIALAKQHQDSQQFKQAEDVYRKIRQDYARTLPKPTITLAILSKTRTNSTKQPHGLSGR